MIVWNRYEDHDLPRYQGRTAREWFTRYHRETALERSGLPDVKTLMECRLAFLEMGHANLPLLVHQVLSPGRDSQARARLHDFFKNMPPWAGRGSFPPHAQAAEAAYFLVSSSNPPADQLLPLLEPVFHHPDAAVATTAASLAGSVGDGAENAASALCTAYSQTSNPRFREAALGALSQLQDRSPLARETVLAAVLRGESADHWLRLIGRGLGPSDTQLLPKIESLLTHTNHARRVQSAVALLKIDPEHAGALRELVDFTTTASQSAARFKKAGSGTLLTLTSLHAAMVRFRPDPSPRLVLILESLLRSEIELWDTSAHHFGAVYALETVAPERAKALLQEALHGPPAVPAAGMLIRLDREHAEATRVLISTVTSDPWLKLNGLSFLAQASSSNRAAIAFLEQVAADPSRVMRSGVGSKIHPRLLQDTAREALATVRYREARAARGLPDAGW
ncbi:MAG: hypothetical protein IT580_11875 [Verrucomicrobiales bacterium]|nr:hypothetical protein [Verrucomicrobiales bacterium]